MIDIKVSEEIFFSCGVCGRPMLYVRLLINL